MSQWISVDERLPDDSHGRVLCWCKEVGDLGRSEFFWNCSYSDRQGFTDNFIKYYVTHWQPVIPPNNQPDEIRKSIWDEPMDN